MDGQGESLLFQRVPQEIRDQIYAHLFSSTRLTFGSRWTSCTAKITVKPAPHGLALLRTCRRARFEIASSWLQHVLFSFEDPYTMLDKLSALPIEMRSKIRHLRVSGEMLEWVVPKREEAYSLADALEALPGLCLDHLTVVCVANDVASYHTFSNLISRGGGWKTLRFVNPTSAMVGFPTSSSIPSSLGDFLREWDNWKASQPEKWQAALEARDGRDSYPSVTVYRAREPGHHGLILQPNECVEYRQKPVQQFPGSYPNAVPEGSDRTGKGEKDRELLIVVKRGAGVNYQEREDSPLVKGGLRERVHGSTWYEIGHPPFWANGRMLPELQPPTVDDYNDPEEHVWTRRHLCENPDPRHHGCDLDER